MSDAFIDFYRVYKDDKDSEPKKKKEKGKYRCIVCLNRFYDSGSLKQHMNSKHGSNSYYKYTAALQSIEEEKRLRVLALMGVTEGFKSTGDKDE